MGKRGEALQEEVLAIMRGGSGPFSAYDVLDALKETHRKIAPPTVYRALAALTKRGQVHRLESLNAYIPCQCADHQQPSVLSICDDCGTVDENIEPLVHSELSSALKKAGFSARRHVIEVHGTCERCEPGPARS